MRHQPRTLPPAEELRILTGIAVQPFVAAMVTFIGFRFLRLDPSGATLDGLADSTDAAVSVAFGTAIVAFLIALICALPTAVWLTRRRRVPCAEAVLFGVLFGNLPFLTGTMLAGSYGIAGSLRGVALSSLLGSCGALAFWAIALRSADHSADGMQDTRRYPQGPPI